MTDSLTSSKPAQASETFANSNPQAKSRFIEPVILIRRMAIGIAIATWMVMAIGSATRVMNAGLACPDWPLCYGSVLPAEQMNLQVFLEWFHRLVASTVGFATIVLFGASWYFRQSLPKWLPWATSGSLSLVVFQGILGGLTVTQLLRFDIVTAHLGTGLLFFSSLLAIFAALTNQTISEQNRTSPKIAWLGLTAAVLIYLQSILGALVASQWALHQCFATQDMCIVLNAHLIGVIPATLASVALVVTVLLTKAIAPVLRFVGSLAGLLVIAQVAIGYATYKLHLQVEPLTIAHQATGSAFLGTLVCFAVLAFRLTQKATSPSQTEQNQAQPAIR
ncbi:COX15/CtaA family protein [Pseudanabaena sp. Chao 1811]|uniref:COX15/CtaA family protein n=1 Tax=Pseudanabaena sp. Chao 1811 TaxID=2963092 RepID=UPI0022F3963A|nr:heme A synthase [Pseudanabaena sp. Chao 1811]